MMSISVSIDLPDMDQGVRFYTEAFGFSKLSEPYPGVVVLKAANIWRNTAVFREYASGEAPPNHRDRSLRTRLD